MAKGRACGQRAPTFGSDGRGGRPTEPRNAPRTALSGALTDVLECDAGIPDVGTGGRSHGKRVN